MKEILRKHHISLKHAIAGLQWAISTQPNFRVHLLLSFVAIGLGFYFQITKFEWLAIVFTIVLGLTVEMANTALESMTDLITKEWRTEAKIAKDVAAGMMLTVAIGAIIVACIVYLPYIFSGSFT